MTTTVFPRPWDSTFFGARILEAHLGDHPVEEVVAEAATADAECLYLFVDAADLVAVEAAVRSGAHLVDLRVELAGTMSQEADAALAATRGASAADRLALLPQAHELAVESRFWRDPRIPQEKVREMYEIWLDRCLDEGFVAVPASNGAGFVGARRDGDVARIDLVYVDTASRGQGLGRALVHGAVAGVGANEASVVTQTGNVAAQRLYQSLGLRSGNSLAVLHLWLDERSG
jgi:ribosomal protein S18 acetylase RimI-like enzyme